MKSPFIIILKQLVSSIKKCLENIQISKEAVTAALIDGASSMSKARDIILGNMDNMKMCRTVVSDYSCSDGGDDNSFTKKRESDNVEGGEEEEEEEEEPEDVFMESDIFAAIKKTIESVRQDHLGRLSPMYYLILDLRPPSIGITQFRAVHYLSEAHLELIGQKAVKATRSNSFDPPLPVRKLLAVLEKLSSRQLTELSSYARAEGSTGILVRLQAMLDQCQIHKRVTLKQLLKEELSEVQSDRTDNPLDSRIVVDLEDVCGTSEYIQWIFYVLDQCRRVISSGVLATNMTERDTDMHLINPFFDILWEDFHMHYGEGESRASRYSNGKHGNHFDWIFSCNSILPDDVRGIELGIVENSGPGQVNDTEKAQVDFIKAVRAARDQLLQIINIIKNKYNSEQLPDIFMDSIKSLFTVAVNIVGYQIKANIVYLFDNNIFVVAEIGCVRLPKSLDRMCDALDVIRLVLRMKALLLKSKQILEVLIEEAMVLKVPISKRAKFGPCLIPELRTPPKKAKLNKSQTK